MKNPAAKKKVAAKKKPDQLALIRRLENDIISLTEWAIALRDKMSGLGSKVEDLEKSIMESMSRVEDGRLLTVRAIRETLDEQRVQFLRKVGKAGFDETLEQLRQVHNALVTVSLSVKMLDDKVSKLPVPPSGPPIPERSTYTYVISPSPTKTDKPHNSHWAAFKSWLEGSW